MYNGLHDEDEREFDPFTEAPVLLCGAPVFDGIE
jgi:hypothetical protein